MKKPRRWARLFHFYSLFLEYQVWQIKLPNLFWNPGLEVVRNEGEDFRTAGEKLDKFPQEDERAADSG